MFGQRKHIQLELFTSHKKEESQRRSLQSYLIEKIVSYERKIILGICFIAVFIVAYSLGIEKGKRISIAEKEKKGDFSIRRSEKSLSNSEITNSQSDNQNNKQVETKEKEIDFKGYTIQVASFKTRASAEREKANLEKKGYKVYIFSKNQYLIVCVGLFKDKEMAKLNQKKLRRFYNDCLIRKL
jgi:hypothetical protein